MRILALLFLLPLLAGCDMFGEPDPTIVFEGIAVDANTNEPVSQIAVQLTRTGLSDVVGRIRLAGDVTEEDGFFLVQHAFNPDEAEYRISIVDRRESEDDSGYFVAEGGKYKPIEPGDRKTVRIEMVWQER